jgi:probable phosphoglycerate mutase
LCRAGKVWAAHEWSLILILAGKFASAIWPATTTNVQEEGTSKGMTTATQPPLFGATNTAIGTTTILIARHAEVHNPQRVFYGRLPEFRLSAWGEKQAERTADLLAGQPITAVYSSPLIRARQTAARIAARHPDAQRLVTGLLNELGTSWQGTPYSQFKAGFSAYEHRREPGDESIEEIATRMVEFVTRARDRHRGETIVGVSHGDPVTILRLALTERPLTVAGLRSAEFVGLGSVTEIVYTPGEARPRVTTLRP